MRIAVTGANGFVGRHVIRRAAARRIDVVGVVRSDEAARTVIVDGGRPVQVAALTAGDLASAFAGVDAVAHFAQIGAERGDATYQAVNVNGTRAAIEGARNAGARAFVYFSGLGVARYGQARRCSNPYFRSKLAAEAAVYDSGLDVAVFRPSYIVGPGDGFVPLLAGDIVTGEVELPDHGAYRMQPIAVSDAADAVLSALERPTAWPLAFDLVGPEPIACAAFVERVGLALRRAGRPSTYRLRSIPIEEAERQAAAGGYRGMASDELDCLLCDELGDPRPLEALLGRFLLPLDEAVDASVRALHRV